MPHFDLTVSQTNGNNQYAMDEGATQEEEVIHETPIE